MFPSLFRRRPAKMRKATKAAMRECGYGYVTFVNREAMRTALATLGEASRAGGKANSKRSNRN